MHGRAAIDFVSLSGCEQMVTEPTHIDGGVPHLVLIDVHNLVEVRVGSPVGTSDLSDIFIHVVLEQPNSLLAYTQEVFKDLCGVRAGQRRCEGSKLE